MRSARNACVNASAGASWTMSAWLANQLLPCGVYPVSLPWDRDFQPFGATPYEIRRFRGCR